MIFGGRGKLGVALHRRDPPHPGMYIINLKLTKYSRWKLGGWPGPVCDLELLELTVITGQFDFLCRQAYRKVTVREQRSMQVSGFSAMKCLVICNGSW